MSSVFIFSGTSEGRELAEKLSKYAVLCDVFVATEYGEQVMEENPYIDIHVGRLDESEIEAMILERNPLYVVDATHPHAKIISENIKAACEKLNVINKYIRVCRDVISFNQENYKNVTVVNSYEESADYLDNIDGNILLTTGVKELGVFASRDNLKERIIARILPGMESITAALEYDIKPRQIVAMEGPFLKEMNEALIKQYDISVLVTKNSGNRGGFLEKLEAAENIGIHTIVVDMNSEKNGISVNEAVKIIENRPHKSISIVGVGVCNEALLTKNAYLSVKNADLIIGAKRLCDFGRSINPKAEWVYEYKALEVAKIIEDTKHDQIAVLFSGDTGFFSGAKGVSEALISLEEPPIIEIHSGVSSISYFASKIVRPYSEAAIVSLHGKTCDYISEFDNKGALFGICSGKEDVKSVISDVKNLSYDVSLYIGKDLGSKDEEIIICENKNYPDDLLDGLYVFAIFKDK